MSKPSPTTCRVLCLPWGNQRCLCWHPSSLQALSDMSDKQDSTVTRSGGDEGSFVISDNRHMLGIFHISPWPGFSSSRVTRPMQCQAYDNNKLKDRAREAALTSDSSSPSLPLGKQSRFSDAAGSAWLSPCNTGKLGKEIARQLSRKSTQVPTHQPPASLSQKARR